jgi:FkbM family methyltransferase
MLDVGANEGQTALRLRRRFPDAEVHSFEPIAETFARLKGKVNGSGVRAVNSAVSDFVGRATLYLGDASEHSGFEAAGEGCDVEVTTVDAYAEAEQMPAIDLLKVDVEGHELAVLRGASELLGNGRVDLVVCECDFESRPSEPHGRFDEIFDFLRPFGYNVVSFYCGGVDELGWRWGDVLLRRVDRASTPRAVAVSPFRERAESPSLR